MSDHRLHARWPAALSLAAAMSLAAPAARAEPAWWQRASLTADGRLEIGSGGVAGIDLGAAGVGAEWWLAPTLRLRTTALFLGATGATDTGRTAGRGGGGELAIRLVPFPTWPVRPYVRLSGGLLLFLRGPFLPGGDFYDFILGAGAGLEIPIAPRLSVAADVHGTHLSNGQGLGGFNPAFNGFGVLASVSWALSASPPVETPALPEPANPRDGWTPGASAEGDAGWASGFVAGGRVRIAERLAPHAVAVLDTRSASYGGAFYQDVGLALVGHWARASAGAQVTYQRLPGIDALAEQAQVEAHLTREASLLATGLLQQLSVFSDLATGAVGVRMFPFDNLRVDGGVAWTRPLARGATTSGSPFAAFEWQLPLGSPDWQVSIFAERQLSTAELAGLRVAWNMGATLRDAARRAAWIRVR